MDKQFCMQKMREQISLVQRERSHFGYAMGFLSALLCADVLTEDEHAAALAELMAAGRADSGWDDLIDELESGRTADIVAALKSGPAKR